MKKFLCTIIVIIAIGYFVIHTNVLDNISGANDAVTTIVEKAKTAANSAKTVAKNGKAYTEVAGDKDLQNLMKNPDPANMTPEQKEIGEKIVNKYGKDETKQMIEKAKSGDISSLVAAYNSVK
jgi:hypothetical protein